MLQGTTMRELVVKYLSQDMSRRKFVSSLTKAGLTATAANSVLASVGSVSLAQAQGAGQTPAAPPAPAAAAAVPPAAAAAAPGASSAVAGVKSFQGPGGACVVEQLIASGVKYVFG